MHVSRAAATAQRMPALPRRGLRVMALAMTSVFLLWHLTASFLWIAPPSPLRQIIPGDALTRYMIPWFGQSWSVFAPEPINGDYHFRVRAVLAHGDDEVVTDWIDATNVELSLATHNLFPPRAAGLAIHQASSLKQAYDSLNQDQRDTAALNYFLSDDWLGRMQNAMVKQGDSPAKVTNYIVQERYSDAYATQVARAVWGDVVLRVQFEASRQNIVPFAERNAPGSRRPPAQVVSSGWRGLIEMPGQSRANFTDVFTRANRELVR